MSRKKRNGKHRTFFDESLKDNNWTYAQYLLRLTELSISMFDWQGLPATVDPRFLELTLFHDGQAVFFQDEVMGYLALQCTVNGRLNVYRIPINRRAYAVNGYNKELTNIDSVIIWNNLLHSNSLLGVEQYAERLWELDRCIDVNARAQKTPVLVQGTEQQRLTLLNLYKEFDGNAPVIFGDKNLDINSLKAINTGAPYVADKLYELKTEYWNEALTYLGISNVNITKKERLITDEVTRNMGGTVASRYSRLEARRMACKEINRMFGLNVTVDYREDFQTPELEDGKETLESNGDNNE